MFQIKSLSDTQTPAAFKVSAAKCAIFLSEIIQVKKSTKKLLHLAFVEQRLVNVRMSLRWIYRDHTRYMRTDGT